MSVRELIVTLDERTATAKDYFDISRGLYFSCLSDRGPLLVNCSV